MSYPYDRESRVCLLHSYNTVTMMNTIIGYR